MVIVLLIAVVVLGFTLARSERKHGVWIHEQWLARDGEFLNDLEAAIREAAVRRRTRS